MNHEILPQVAECYILSRAALTICLQEIKQARYRALAAKAINARLLYAPTIIINTLLQVTIMFDA